MKKALALALFFSLLMSLCSCSSKSESSQQIQTDTPTEPEKYWQAGMENLYPMGAKGQVEAMAVCNDCIFVAGRENNLLSLVRMEYAYQNNQPEFGHPQLMPLPEKPVKVQILGLSCNQEKVYILLGFPQEDGSPYLTYQVWIFATEGSLEKRLTVDFPAEDFPLDVLALSNGHFCITGSLNYTEFDSDGGTIMSLQSSGDDFLTAMLIGENVIIQSANLQTGASKLNLVDRKAQTLIPIENTEEFGRAVSLCQGQGSTALINNGAYLLTIDENYKGYALLDWYQTTGDYGYNYSHICQLNSNCFLLIQKDTGELNCLNMQYIEDERMALRVGLYGHAADVEDQIHRALSGLSPHYRVDLVSYGNDDAGMTRLISDLNGDNAPELIISEGYLINPSAGFADLYPFIDNDAELSRDSFLPFILQGLERDGKLPQIWGCFGLYSAIATGTLAHAPEPLKLVDSQDFLDSVGYSESLFDEYFTREILLSCLADSLIFSAWDAESERYNLEKDNIRALIELCASLPKEYDFNRTEPPITSHVLAWRDITLEYLSYLENEKLAFQFFTDTENNLAQIAAYYNSCYMIPENCQDKEKVWNFLRELLTAEYQMEVCANGYHGFPTNAQAYDTIVNAYLSEQLAQELRSIMENASFSGYETFQAKTIFKEGLLPYLYGDAKIDEAISSTQSRINIFTAERAN